MIPWLLVEFSQTEHCLYLKYVKYNMVWIVFMNWLLHIILHATNVSARKLSHVNLLFVVRFFLLFPNLEYVLQYCLRDVTFHSLLDTVARYSLQNLLVILCRSYSLTTRFKILSAEVARCKKLLVTRYTRYPRTNVYIKRIKIGEFYLFILYFWSTKTRERLRIQ